MSVSLRDRIIGAAVFGAVAGVSVASFAQLLRSGFQPSEVLSFAGALGGAAAAVAGAVWLSDRSALAESRRERAFIEQECQSLIEAVRATYRAKGSDEVGTTRGWLFQRSEEFPAILKQAGAHARTLTFRQRARIIKLEVAASNYLNFCENRFSSHEEVNEDAWTRVSDEYLVALVELLRALRSEG